MSEYDLVAFDDDGAIQWGISAAPYASSGATIDNIIEAVRKSLGYVDNPLTKCRHCGQWGAVYCPCAHCGAPIDP